MNINTEFLLSHSDYIILYLFIINVLSLLLCGIDKYRAIINHPRIREKTLLLLSVIGGAVFMLIGMIIFRHKTRKPVFMLIVPSFAALQLLLIFLSEAEYGILSDHIKYFFRI